MSLTQEIGRAQQQVERTVLERALGKQRTSIADLSSLLEKPVEIDAVLSSSKEGYTLVLPIATREQTLLEKRLLSTMGTMLEKYNSSLSHVNGYHAYTFTSRPELGRNLHLQAGDVPFKVHITRTKLDLSQPQNVPTDTNPYMPSQKLGDRIEVAVDTTAAKNYNLIPLRKSERTQFPGYRVPFIIRYGKDQQITTHVSSAPKSTPRGACAGTYLASGIGKLYKAYPRLSKATTATFKVLEPGKIYEFVSCK